MPLKLQFLLRKEHRGPKAAGAVKKLLADFGVRPTVAGAATVSAEMDAPDFERLFGRTLEESDAPGTVTSVGFREPLAGADIPIPHTLRDYIASVTLAPEYIRLGQQQDDKK